MQKTAKTSAKSQPNATTTTSATASTQRLKENELGKQLEAAIFPNATRNDIIADKNRQIALLQQELAEGLC